MDLILVGKRRGREVNYSWPLSFLLVPGQFGPEERERESIDGVSRIGPTILWAETLKY